MKKYLLDTHTLIWAMVDRSKLSKLALKILQDYDAHLFVSAVSFWEIALKNGKGKLDLVNFQLQHIPYYCGKLGVQQIPLTPEDAISYSKLPFAEEHKDPFDRMLICQSISGDYTLVSRDDKMKSYEKYGLKCIW